MALLADQYTLAQDATFQHRVEAALVAAAFAIVNESVGTPAHDQRIRLSKKVLANPIGYATLMAVGIATDATVGTDATSPPNQSLVTDAHITAAVSAQWNSYALD